MDAESRQLWYDDMDSSIVEHSKCIGMPAALTSASAAVLAGIKEGNRPRYMAAKNILRSCFRGARDNDNVGKQNPSCSDDGDDDDDDDDDDEICSMTASDLNPAPASSAFSVHIQELRWPDLRKKAASLVWRFNHAAASNDSYTSYKGATSSEQSVVMFPNPTFDDDRNEYKTNISSMYCRTRDDHVDHADHKTMIHDQYAHAAEIAASCLASSSEVQEIRRRCSSSSSSSSSSNRYHTPSGSHISCTSSSSSSFQFAEQLEVLLAACGDQAANSRIPAGQYPSRTDPYQSRNCAEMINNSSSYGYISTNNSSSIKYGSSSSHSCCTNSSNNNNNKNYNNRDNIKSSSNINGKGLQALIWKVHGWLMQSLIRIARPMAYNLSDSACSSPPTLIRKLPWIIHEMDIQDQMKSPPSESLDQLYYHASNFPLVTSISSPSSDHVSH